ncbi:MAG: dTDP-4-dehydrorhamnose reductase [Bryobacteraceae bacterium]
MSRKIAVLGSAGQLGVELVTQLRARGCEVAAWDKPELDITDPAATERELTGLAPDLVINSAAYNMVDVAEQEPLAAFQVNALAVRNIAVACRQMDVPLVHYSTDYVFDGTSGRPYTEEDRPHPLGAYAVSKLAGELYAQAYLDETLIIRTSGVYGPGGLATARGNFVETMLLLAQKGQPIRVTRDNVASPAYAPALAGRTLALLDRGARGIYHVGGGVPVSWFDFAALIFEAAGLKPELRPSDAREYRTAARRPKYSALSNAKMEALGVAPMPPMREALEDYFRRRRERVTPPPA